MGQSETTSGGKSNLSGPALQAATMPLVSLPAEGEALLPARVCAGAAGVSESTWWAWVAEPGFPVQPVRRGERFTRFKLSEMRDWIASLSAGDAKESPAQRRRSKAAEALIGQH